MTHNSRFGQYKAGLCANNKYVDSEQYCEGLQASSTWAALANGWHGIAVLSTMTCTELFYELWRIDRGKWCQEPMAFYGIQALYHGLGVCFVVK